METPPECSPEEGHGSGPPGLSCLIRAADKPEAWKQSPAKIKGVLDGRSGTAAGAGRTSRRPAILKCPVEPFGKFRKIWMPRLNPIPVTLESLRVESVAFKSPGDPNVQPKLKTSGHSRSGFCKLFLVKYQRVNILALQAMWSLLQPLNSDAEKTAIAYV